MAKNTGTVTVETAAADVVSAFERFVAALSNGVAAPAEPVEDDDVEEDDDEDEDAELDAPVREEVESLGIKELRALAAEYGIEATKKADILAEFEDLYESDEEDDEDEDDDEDEADEDESDEWTREELEELDLKELRKIAKEAGASASDVKSLDQDDLIDLIMGEEADEDDEEDDDESDEDEDVEELDEDALKAMTQKELLALAKELEVKVPAALKKTSKANQKKLVDLILDSGEDED
jgi:hypothetical protein